MIFKTLIYLLVLFFYVALPFIIVSVMDRFLWPQVQSKRVLFLSGVVLLGGYFVGICVPYYFQGYATMPITIEAAQNPTGLLALFPRGLFSYLYGIPLLGIYWLLLGGLLIVLGRASDQRRLDRPIRFLVFATYLFFLVHVGDYARVSLILDT